MSALQPFLRSIKVPVAGDRIYKDECVYSFQSPEHQGGLFICLKTFLGLAAEFLPMHYQRTQSRVYAHYKKTKRELPAEETSAKPTVMGIGVEGGFQTGEKKFTFDESYQVFLYDPDQSGEGKPLHGQYFPYPSNDLPSLVEMAVAEIIKRQSAGKADEAAVWEEPKIVSKYAETLVQLNNGVRIPPKGWKCVECGLGENLWLNLTDGGIFCGRANWMGTGGSGHALKHFEQTGFPLCVKLGTITPQGADVWSYAEDSEVIDPKLADHLAHFGIDMMAMQKTEKTLTELQIDLNRDYQTFASATKDSEVVSGPGLTGLVNLGNSCYMNAVMQTMCSLPEFMQRYGAARKEIFRGCRSNDPTADFDVQMAKLVDALHSYKPPSDGSNEPSGIAPRMLKTVVGKNHPEFSTNRQCDAAEFYQHLIDVIRRADRAANPQLEASGAFRFRVEERIECTVSHTVRYTYREDNVLTLGVPMEQAINLAEVTAYREQQQKAEAAAAAAEGGAASSNEAAGSAAGSLPATKKPRTKIDEAAPRPIVPFEACLRRFLEPDLVEQYFNTALNANTTVQKTTRLATFPKYLMVQLRKFYLSDNWEPLKLDVSVPVPSEGASVDFSPLKGTGPQPGESLMPETAANSSSPGAAPAQFWKPNADFLTELLQMGFPEPACKRALHAVNNQDTQIALEWLCTHMEDPDFAAPFVAPQISGGGAPAGGATEENFDPASVDMLVAMGFTAKQAKKALKACNGSLERAADWVFTHTAELDADDEDSNKPAAAPVTGAGASADVMTDGKPIYSLYAIISHMGRHAGSGHYVCHIRKDNRWVLFNDEKVSVVADGSIPWELAYMYLFRRLDAQ